MKALLCIDSFDICFMPKSKTQEISKKIKLHKFNRLKVHKLNAKIS